MTNPYIDAAQNARAEALLQVLGVVQRYMPPDGISAQDAMSEIIALVDPLPGDALQAQASAPVPGYVLVPVEPTPKMIKAWHDAYATGNRRTGRSAVAYAAMLAAAPTPEPVAAGQQAVRDAALEEAARAAYLRLHPNNELSDWTEFAHDQARAAKAAAAAIRSLKSTNGGAA
ncbi:hypothetical protein BER2_1677 [plant metagenome]|uniref:Uncharacterized protein n=1 Tax=plant metagenome TaxID=1297885 RepID=A0A484R4Z8_9ZZZZ